MTVEDIRNVVFDKTLGRGYRMEQVDSFLSQVAAEMERMEREKEDIEKKLYILAEKVDQYRDDEDTLKTALLNAQRMGESVIYEARQKAETIVYEANTKASRLKDESRQVVLDAQEELKNLKVQVGAFKKSVLDLYRQHIELLGSIPEERSIEFPEDEFPEPIEDLDSFDALADSQDDLEQDEIDEQEPFFEEEIEEFEEMEQEYDDLQEQEEYDELQIFEDEEEVEQEFEVEEEVVYEPIMEEKPVKPHRQAVKKENSRPSSKKRTQRQHSKKNEVSFGSYEDITFH